MDTGLVQVRRERSVVLRRTIIAALSLSAVAAPVAFAQNAAAERSGNLEEVVVTGVRGSLQNALEIKRASLQVVDSIVAEDVGKLPDNNVADAWHA